MVSLETLAIADVGWAEYGQSIEDWDVHHPAYLPAEDGKEENEQGHDHGAEEKSQCVQEVGKSQYFVRKHLATSLKIPTLSYILSY